MAQLVESMGCGPSADMTRRPHPQCTLITWVLHPLDTLHNFLLCRLHLPLNLCPLRLLHLHQILSVTWRTWTRCSAWLLRTLTNTAASSFRWRSSASSSCTGLFTSIWAILSLMTLSTYKKTKRSMIGSSIDHSILQHTFVFKSRISTWFCGCPSSINLQACYRSPVSTPPMYRNLCLIFYLNPN